MFEQPPLEAYNALSPMLKYGPLVLAIIAERILARYITGNWLGRPGRRSPDPSRE